MVKNTPQLRILRFENELEDIVKRHQPIAWAIAAAVRLKRWGQEVSPGVVWTPHELLDSIEACCRYRRGHREEPVTEKRLRQAINVYRSHADPYAEYLIQVENDIDLWGQAAWRQQLELQISVIDEALLRSFHFWMYGDDNAFSATNKAFVAAQKLNMRQLFAVTLVLQGLAETHDGSLIERSHLEQLENVGYPLQSVEAVINRLSRGPDQIREDYKQDKDELLKSPQLRFSVRSTFLDKPLMREGTLLLAPLPHLLTKATDTLMANLGMDFNADSYEDELSSRFELFVGMLLEGLPSLRAIINEPALKKLYTGKVTDFVVVCNSCVVIVECKATRASTKFIVKGAVARDTSTRQVVEGLRQAAFVANQMKDGRLPHISQGESLPIISIVVTLDRLAFANSEWYWREGIGPLFGDDDDLQRALQLFACKPQIMSATELAILVAISMHTQKCVSSLFQEKLALPYRNVGDWTPYLDQRLPAGATAAPLHLIERVEQFYVQIREELVSKIR